MGMVRVIIIITVEIRCLDCSSGNGYCTAGPFMISTRLETSYLMLSGSDKGSGLPTGFILQRYMANAISGK
jgi:hypothetical protein